MLRTRALFSIPSVGLTAVIGGLAVAGLFAAGLGKAQDGDAGPVVQFAAPPTFADVFEQVNAAVVDIAVTKRAVLSPTASRQPFAGAPFEDFLERFGLPDDWQPMPARGQGSGFVIDAAGFIATNNHVIDGASEVSVTLASGETLQAEVVGADERTDLALLRIDYNGELPALRLGDSDRTRVGEWVLAIGNPFGLGGSATAGIVSARGRDIQSGFYDDYLQIDAPINSGNSGGPVFNAAGEVIGINTAIFSPTGGNVGIGFAIPSNLAGGILDELRERGSVSRGWLGVGIGEDPQGVGIERVEAGGPAANAGLKAGDVVLRFDGEPVTSPRELARLVGGRDSGDTIDIEILREGSSTTLTVVLGALEQSDARAALAPESRRFLQPFEPGQRFFRR